MSVRLAFTAGVLLLASSSWAGSRVRYALVIGNNQGLSKELALEPLQHAQRDAMSIARSLERFGNFQRDRIAVVVGGTREEILATAQRLAAQHARDRRELGELPTLFAFFFTGHGLAGKLLTADQPLDGSDLSNIFSQMGAQLSVAFIDACYAGSFDWDALKAKGATATPGFNPVTELPKEVLDAEGSMWFVSSQAGELSYEDRTLGGLFTHFLLEGFTQAPRDNVGVSLENLWEYARQKTSSYAARKGRVQNPERIVRRLKSRSPIYLSFPSERTARLRFESGVEGEFVLQYEQAALVEKIQKRAGSVLEVAAYDGEAVLRRVGGPGKLAAQRLVLQEGTQWVVGTAGGASGGYTLGYSETPVRSKGELTELRFSQRAPATTLSVGVHGAAGLSADAVLDAPARVGLSTLVAHGPLSFSLQLGGGTEQQQFSDWSYRFQQWNAELFAGYGFEAWWLRFDVEVGAGPRLAQVRYGDGARREAWGGWAGGGLRAQLPIPFRAPWVLVHVRGLGGALAASSVAARDQQLYFTPTLHLEAGLTVPFPAF